MELARPLGIEVFIDGAHSFAHFPFTRDELRCDYFARSLHKWLLAPIGTGFLYVRKSKIKSIWPLMAAAASQSEDIRKYEEIGTHPAANHNAIARGAGVPPGHRRRAEGRPAAFPPQPMGQTPAGRQPDASRSGRPWTTTPRRAASRW